MAKLYATRYPTMNWSDYNASLKRRGSLSVWFDQKMTWYARRSGKRGHPETSSDSTIQTRRTLKALFGLPLRRSEPVRRHWSEAHGEGHTFPWDGEWLACKHDSTRRCECRKAHLAMDTVTGDIRAVEFTSSRQGDSSILPELLSQIPDGENIDTVTTDGAHDTGRCHAAILEHGGEPIIPIRRHGGAWKPDFLAAIARNEILSATRNLGWSIWKKWACYHARSRVEVQMNRLELFGECIISCDPDHQSAEIQICIAIMNHHSALGRAEIEAVA